MRNRLVVTCWIFIALLLLLLERNSWERWIATATLTANGNTVSDSLLPTTKWTSSGTSCGGNVGWSAEGNARFNELVQLEMNHRSGPRKEEGKEVERKYLDARKLATGKKRKRDQIAQPPTVVCIIDTCPALAQV